MPNEEITLDDIMGKLIAIEANLVDRLNTLSENVRVGVERIDSELHAIRHIVDNDLAGQGQVMALEGQVKEIARTVARLEKSRIP